MGFETTNHLPSLIICAVGVCLFITGFRFGAGPLAPQTVIDICNGKRRKIRKENGSDNSIDQDTIQMRGINAPLKIAQDSEVKVEAPEKEMKSISWRNTAIGIASSFSWVGSVFISTAFLPIVDRISFGGGFLFLAFINFIGFVFSLTFVQ
ncbi:MAG: hypothetical protein EZS28_013570 [Streblomastix strix]|uniref:Uncharacterized protein n=1 Tax=Streblomastix strix TaxID=222440 RepID=A0A5J4W8T0_9EUKA|nr:MAG: hypothetical protein EZS28_013570 [Streblomastix strix]